MIHSVWGLIIACGKSEQLSASADIPFLSVGTNPVLAYSLMAFEQCAEIDAVAIVTSKERLDTARGVSQLFGCTKVQKVITGFSQHVASVTAGLEALKEEATVVVIHDASRPCVRTDLIGETVKAAKRYGSGVAAERQSGVVKLAAKGRKPTDTFDGSSVWGIQTPQAYRTEVLQEALQTAKKKKITLKDESSALELIGKDLQLVPAPPGNMKITSMDELSLAAGMLRL